MSLYAPRVSSPISRHRPRKRALSDSPRRGPYSPLGTSILNYFAPMEHHGKDTVVFFGKGELEALSQTLPKTSPSSTNEAGRTIPSLQTSFGDIEGTSSSTMEPPVPFEPVRQTDLSTPEDEEDDARAIDPETGEINWDCPCLAEAVAPPCGEFFKSAFSCYIKSQTQPKGEDCEDLFFTWKTCCLQHPEIYAPHEEEETTPSQDHATPESSAHPPFSELPAP